MLTLLPFINPISLLTKGVSLVYLASWPFIIQNLGQDVLLSQSLIIILLMISCDIARQLVVRRIGFDFVSIPVGLLILSGLNSDQGAAFLALSKPIYTTLLLLIKPVLILVETYYILEILRKFNRWMSKEAHVRETNETFSWEPSLSRRAVIVRILIISITIISYVGTYFATLKCQQNLYQSIGSIPGSFEQAIFVMVTLQFLAGTTTIIKEEGIISETAMICFMSSVSILIASLHQSQIITSALLESGIVAAFLMTFSNIFSTKRDVNNRSARDGHLISRQTLIKIILLLSYTQMLVQQHSQQETKNSWFPFDVSSLSWLSFGLPGTQSVESMLSFGAKPPSMGDLASNFLTNLLNGFQLRSPLRTSGNEMNGLPAENSLSQYMGPTWTWEALDQLWLKKLNTTTVQRLLQSMAIQIFYILSLIFGEDDDDNDDNDNNENTQ